MSKLGKRLIKSAMEARIPLLCDAGRTPAQIAATLRLPVGNVYAVLRQERPKRKRAPRRRTSGVPARVAALSKAGVGAARVAELLRVSRAYVYRLISEAH